jgi:hypothetical protein
MPSFITTSSGLADSPVGGGPYGNPLRANGEQPLLVRLCKFSRVAIVDMDQWFVITEYMNPNLANID